VCNAQVSAGAHWSAAVCTQQGVKQAVLGAARPGCNNSMAAAATVHAKRRRSPFIKAKATNKPHSVPFLFRHDSDTKETRAQRVAWRVPGAPSALRKWGGAGDERKGHRR
jgi:hypothetical protein